MRSRETMNEKIFYDSDRTQNPNRDSDYINSVFHSGPNNFEIFTLHSWFNRKKRRNGPLLYNRSSTKTNFFRAEHPSKYSSYNYVQGTLNKQRETGATSLLWKKESQMDYSEGTGLDEETIWHLKNAMDEHGVHCSGANLELLHKLRELSQKMRAARDSSNEKVEASRIVKSPVIKRAAREKRAGPMKNDPLKAEETNFMSLEHYYF